MAEMTKNYIERYYLDILHQGRNVPVIIFFLNNGMKNISILVYNIQHPEDT